jgi:hypothetical protein
MANRTPVDRGEIRARVTPVASPVDTYVHDEAGHGLSQLADALTSVAPEVAKFSDVKAQQQTESQKAAGEQRARELFESGKTYRDAIKNGDIAPHESPWFILGAKEQFGRVMAGKMESDLADAVKQNGQLQESTDVADFDKFSADFRKDWLEKNVGADNRDLNFERSFGSLSDNLMKDSRSAFVNAAGQRLVQKSSENVYAEGFSMLKHEYEMKTDHTAIAQGFQLVLARAHAMGLNDRASNIAVVQAIGDMVQKTGDVTLFDLLDKIQAGDKTLADRPWAQEEIQKTTDKVWTDTQRHHNAETQQQEEARTTASRTMVGNLIATMVNSDNASALDLRKDIAALAHIDPQAAETMTRFQAAATSAHFQSDENTVTAQQAHIFTVTDTASSEYVTTNSLASLLIGGALNKDDFQNLNAQVQRRDAEAERAKKEADKKKNAYADPRFKAALGTLARPGFLTSGSSYDKTDTQERVKSAQAEFGNDFLTWLDSPAGQSATPLQRNQFLTELLDQVAGNWRTDEASTDAKGVGKVQDLRTPGQKARARALVNRIESETAHGPLSQEMKDYLRNNNVSAAELPEWLRKQKAYLGDQPYDIDAYLTGKPQPSLPKKPKALERPAPAASDGTKR